MISKLAEAEVVYRVRIALLTPKTRKTLTKRAIAIKKLNEHEKRKHKR
jgi:hypothetical protein